MIDFSLFNPAGSNIITMSDVMVTICAFMAGWVRWAQKNKDEQIKALLDTIKHQKDQIEQLSQTNTVLHQKVIGMLDNLGATK